jgi:exodeoxyribonuclease V alpha subunit
MKPAELAPIDRTLSAFLAGMATTGRDAVERAAAELSRKVRLGNVCLALSEIDDPSIAEALRNSGVAGRPGEPFPLVLDDAGRLYLHRMWRHEADVATFFRERAAAGPLPVDGKRLEESLARLFPPQVGCVPDLQREAAARAASRPVYVVSGGPGTGKTTTVVKVLALMLEQADGAPLEIALSAPTGKAAARLRDSVAESAARLAVSGEIRDRLPKDASTLHRLLGSRGPGAFRHDRGNPLPYDVVVVDEASMVDLPLMARLAEATPRGARLILLGDKDQLASVEAGAVFADLCEAKGPMSGCVSVLARNYRFGDDGPIAKAAKAIREGEGEEALALLRGSAGGPLAWADLPEPAAMESFLRPYVLDGYGPFLKETTPEGRFRAFSRFRILAAHREGAHGVSGLNRTVERILSREGLIRPGRAGGCYPGQPLLVTSNDHALRLYNGNTGIVLPDERDGGLLKAFFPDESRRTSPGVPGDGGAESPPAFRAIPLSRLPEHETAWATTVHKSQGEEFDEVLLILGSSASGFVGRELVYTGVTRAKAKATVAASPSSFPQVVRRRIDRASGLGEGLAHG